MHAAIRLSQIARALDPKYVKVREWFLSLHLAAPCMIPVCLQVLFKVLAFRSRVLALLTSRFLTTDMQLTAQYCMPYPARPGIARGGQQRASSGGRMQPQLTTKLRSWRQVLTERQAKELMHCRLPGICGCLRKTS